MVWIRAILIVFLTFSASVSGAMDVHHVANAEHEHTAVVSMTDDAPACCDDSTERGQSCHVMPALLADASDDITAPLTGETAYSVFRHFLDGIEPSGPVDPPRLV